MAKFLNLPAEYSNLGNDNDASGSALTSKDLSPPKPKRKGEDKENSTPSGLQPQKKPRGIQPPSVRTALPKYTSTRLRSGTAAAAIELKKSATLGDTADILGTISSTASSAATKSLVGSIFASGASTSTTPSKGILSSVIQKGTTAFKSLIRSPTPSSASKRPGITNTPLKADIPQNLQTAPSIPPPPTIKELFEAGFSIDDDAISCIIANLRVKSKWDTKEKMNKMSLVITELRAALKTTFEETKVLKQKSMDVESRLAITNQRVLSEFSVARQQVIMLSKEDVRLKEELSEIMATVKTLQNEKSEQLHLVFESESKCLRLAEELRLLEKRGIEREASFDALQDEISQSKSAGQEALASMKEDYEQVYRTS